MIYFYNATTESQIVKHYKQTLTTDLQKRYDRISKERRNISYAGYLLGFVFSLFVLYYNFYIKKERFANTSLVCIVVATMFITNYFFYMLYPKSDWMLDHVNHPEQVKAWLQMYKAMGFYYHAGLALGLIAAGIFAFAFRC
jgi:glucan phosphoethanolaminetransferase (alkaline phosphatase superfamily)